jgi:uncharacterized protein (TIGR00159 family)
MRRLRHYGAIPLANRDELLDFFAFDQWGAQFGLADAFDVAVVAALCYLGLSWLRRHASPSMLTGAILVLALYGVARIFDLYLTSLLFETGAVAIVVALLLIFQDDLRRAAEQFALRGFLADDRSRPSSSTIDLIAETARELAEDHIGAILVFPGQEPLERLLRGGERLNGVLSRSLLVSIFHPGSPGHDGAVLIDGDVITRFAVHLPLSRFPEKVGREGTRHSAALGLAEQSDALVVVVSEERGTISVAHQGILEVVEAATLNERLEKFVHDLSPQPAGRAVWEWLLANPGLKLASLLLAVLLWLGLAYGVETVQRQYPAPIQYRNLPADWAVDETTRPLQARVTLSGSERVFERFDPSQLAVSLDLTRPREGSADYPLTTQQVTGNEELEVIDVTPSSALLETYRVETLALPVRVRLRNDLPPGVALDRVEARPARLYVQAPVSAEKLTAVETEPVDLSRLEKTMTLQLNLEFPRRVRLGESQPTAVEATIYLKPAQESGKD